MNNKELEKAQPIIVIKEHYLEDVLTLAEASEKLGITDAYLRRLVLDNEFESWEYKKSGRVTIFLAQSIQAREERFKKNKNKKNYRR